MLLVPVKVVSKLKLSLHGCWYHGWIQIPLLLLSPSEYNTEDQEEEEKFSKAEKFRSLSVVLSLLYVSDKTDRAAHNNLCQA